MDKVEFYMEVYVITPLIKYLKDNNFKKILYHFDTTNAVDTNVNKIYNVLLSEGFEVEQFHINDSVDCIVSNPPYSLKEHVFETLLSTGKPFAMLVGVVGLFVSDTFEITYMNKRVGYDKDFESGSVILEPPFNDIFLTNIILPKQMVFESILYT